MSSPLLIRFSSLLIYEVEKNSFITLPGKEDHSRLTPSKLCPDLERAERSFIVMGSKGKMDQFVGILLIAW